MKSKTVKLPSEAEVEIKRPGVLKNRAIVAAMPNYAIAGKVIAQSELTRDQLVEFYDYQIAMVRAFTGMDDEALDAMDHEDFKELFGACQEWEGESRKALGPTSKTPNSS